ncbi:MAG: GGDEF domain-containing protein [Candidatus Gracilibacteria bacterium]|nr:GGDEF domain-containing protein [Candidatus Gracilibacteria bacterium]
MKNILNGVLVAGALTLGIPEKSKAQDIIDLSKVKIEKTVGINNKEKQLNNIIDQKIDESNLTEKEKIQVKELLKDERFKATYSELLKKDDLLSTENIVLISVLIGILICIVLFKKTRKEKEYLEYIEKLEDEKDKMQKNMEGLEIYVQTILNEGNGNVTKLKELFDLAPFPITKYKDDGFPEVWNKKMTDETGFTHQNAIDYYNEEIKKTDGTGNEYLEKRGEVMTMLYKNTAEHKDLDNTLEYLGMLDDAKKDGYSNIPFTLTTKVKERKTLLWTTRPVKEGGTLRFGIPKDQKIEELEDLLRKDVLTGAFNRRKLNEDFTELCSKVNREGDNKKYTIIMLDLDGFKPINDVYGHPFGDKILIEFSKYMQKSIRTNDKLYRYGGDEFILIMETDNTDEVAHKLNKIRKTFFDITFTAVRIDKKESGETDAINVGSSWGIKTINISDLNNETDKEKIDKQIETIKEEIDEYMYRAKGFRFIKEQLISDGKIDESWQEKNAIAEAIEQDGKIVGVRILLNNTDSFDLTLDDVRLINTSKVQIIDSGIDLRSV